jgi:hypothetical protein
MHRGSVISGDTRSGCVLEIKWEPKFKSYGAYAADHTCAINRDAVPGVGSEVDGGYNYCFVCVLFVDGVTNLLRKRWNHSTVRPWRLARAITWNFIFRMRHMS